MSFIFYLILLGICFLLGLFAIYLALYTNSALPLQNLGTKDLLSTAALRLKHGTSANINDFKLMEAIAELETENNLLKAKIQAQYSQNISLLRHNDDLNKIVDELAQEKQKLYARKKQLEELQVRKDELFAIIIHDLKNPAHALKGFVEILSSYQLNADEQQSIMLNLVKLSNRIVEIAQSISTIIAQAENTENILLKPRHIKPIIDEVCNQNKLYAESKKVQIVNNSSPDTPLIPMDEFKIEKALENLVNNAIKFAREETVVQVISFFDSSKVIIEISDNGVGMSHEDVSMAFNRGGKLTAQPTGNETSSGLGLWIVKNIIEGHGGSVHLESRLGIGTKFTIRLPIKS